MSAHRKKTLDAVIKYRRLGFRSVPIPLRKKGPNTKGWNQLRLDEPDLLREFGQEDRNNGLLLGEPSVWLTDVDLDCSEAVSVAREILPETGRWSGRESRPYSHALYICPDSRTKQYEDPEGKMLVEIRSTGLQTLAPPSIHPEDEECQWYEEGEFGRVDPRTLERRTALVATTALFARHWPAQGSRHNASLALAGFLLRGGLDVDWVKRIIGSAAHAARDEEAESRVANVETTAEKIKANEKVTGGPTAVEFFGSAVIDKCSKWLDLRSGSDSDGDGDGGGGSSQVDQLESLAVSEVHLFHSPDEKTYVSFRVGDHWETWPTASKRFRRWLSRRFTEKNGRGPGRKTLDDAVLRLEERAIAEGEQLDVHVRVAGKGGRIYLDVGDNDWSIIEVTDRGWRVIKECPAKFRRSNGMLPLPTPVAGGSVSELRRFLNFGTEENWTLMVAYLVGAFCPQGPHPVLALFGEQGSAKSTTASVLRRFVDPHEAERRTQPKIEDLFIAATNSWILNYDNLSYINQELSDAFCQISTGGAMSKRALYTDDGEYIAQFQRPVIINGIDEVMTRSDLMDRSIILEVV